MGENSKIEWTTHTFNPWRGCSKVSAGCTNCYAEKLSHRNPGVLGIWGDNGTRIVASEATWREPLKWDHKAKEAGDRHRVFCASLADVFENRLDLIEPRTRLFRLIDATPHLDWLLLTKRPENIRECFGATCLWGDGWLTHPRPNLWLGVSVEDQKSANERIPVLLQIPVCVRFLSVEPLLESINLRTGIYTRAIPLPWHSEGTTLEGISWVIVGGESGPKARPFNITWARSLRDQCADAGVPFFLKQWGSHVVAQRSEVFDLLERVVCKVPDRRESPWRLRLKDSKGGDWNEWPMEYRVRQFPNPNRSNQCPTPTR